mgnify:CR=1 FL=1
MKKFTLNFLHIEIFKYHCIIESIMITSDMNVEEYLKNGKKKKKKKNYTLYLDEDIIKSLKENLDVSLSFIVNDFLKFVDKKVQEKKNKRGDKKNSDKNGR